MDSKFLVQSTHSSAWIASWFDGRYGNLIDVITPYTLYKCIMLPLKLSLYASACQAHVMKVGERSVSVMWLGRMKCDLLRWYHLKERLESTLSKADTMNSSYILCRQKNNGVTVRALKYATCPPSARQGDRYRYYLSYTWVNSPWNIRFTIIFMIFD